MIEGIMTMKKTKGKALLMICVLLFAAGCGKESQDDGTGNFGESSADAQRGTDTYTDADRRAMLECYAAILEEVYSSQTLPGGEELEYQPGSNYDVTANNFAVCDIDGDGKEELIISYSTTHMAGITEIIYGFDAAGGSVYEEFREFPALTYYDNGVVEAQLSHDHGMSGESDFWPYVLYQYSEEKDVYELVAGVDAWNKSYRETDDAGNSFPDEADADGDGMVYYLTGGEKDKSEGPLDGEEYQQWRDSVLGNGNIVQIAYKNLTADNISALVPHS